MTERLFIRLRFLRFPAAISSAYSRKPDSSARFHGSRLPFLTSRPLPFASSDRPQLVLFWFVKCSLVPQGIFLRIASPSIGSGYLLTRNSKAMSSAALTVPSATYQSDAGSWLPANSTDKALYLIYPLQYRIVIVLSWVRPCGYQRSRTSQPSILLVSESKFTPILNSFRSSAAYGSA